MKSSTLALTLLGCALSLVGAGAQTLPLEFRPGTNVYNRGFNAGSPPPVAVTSPTTPNLPTPRQFSGAVLVSGVGAPRAIRQPGPVAGTNFGEQAAAVGLPMGSNPARTIVLARAQLATPYAGRTIAFFFGSVIPVPQTGVDEVEITGRSKEEYWLPQPHSIVDRPGDYYWSPHAKLVYAINPGLIKVTWRRRAPEVTEPKGPDASDTNKYAFESGLYYPLESRHYLVSAGPVKPPRKIYWTEGDFSNRGIQVRVPTSRVGHINVVYNNTFPALVDMAYLGPGEVPQIQDPAQRLQERRTLWYELDAIHAYNREGRVFVELLGDETSQTEREQLGFEIVDVIQEPALEDVPVRLGYPLTPYKHPLDQPELTDEEKQLYPQEVVVPGGQSYAFSHTVAGSDRATLYAVRETHYLNGNVQNELLVHWMEEGLAGLRWPRLTVRYELAWPNDIKDYSHYLRQNAQNAEQAKETAVPMPSANAPIIAYQDPSDQPRAFLTPDLKFYTVLNTQVPAHRTLLRFTVGNEVAFERVFSWLDEGLSDNALFAGSVATNLSAWQAGKLDIDPSAELQAPRVFRQTVAVGQRLSAPGGELGSSPADGYWAGHLRTEAGTAYDVNTYVDPFVSGFEEAAQGSIIPVNVFPRNQLQVWWFRRNQFGARPGLAPIHWPSVIGHYTIVWPGGAREIVLASNRGSGPLLSLEANGQIYHQNDPAMPGYNPNEEHALMLGGQAYALRNDLNDVTGDNYTSEPYVLLEYVDADGRPDMLAFRVLREKPEENLLFDYAAKAGTILQAPMPLPLLELPLVSREVGEPLRSLNEEIAAPAAPVHESLPDHYDRFTLQDRKGNTWVYRGPHNPQDHPLLEMKFYYKTLPGFFFPGLSLAQQPPVGTITPYLRPLENGEPVGEPVLGDADNNRLGDGNPLRIKYRPIWPPNAPVLLQAESLTLPKRGLPSVRGQSSLGILYQQSLVKNLNELGPDSVVLHDPTREKQFPLGESGSDRLDALPESIKTQRYRGNTFFPALPPHLSERFFLDPNRSAHGALVLKGQFVDAPTGEDYLLLNVLGEKDVGLLKALCDGLDDKKQQWDRAIDGLATEMQKWVESLKKPGTFEVATRTPVALRELAQATHDDVAVDSYALTAVGGGTGFVTLIAGNGLAFTPKADPISVLVFKVADQLYGGELKTIESPNPLSELLTLQQVVDLAGKAEQYTFDWRISSPVDGDPLPVYQNTPVNLLPGGTTWKHVRFPTPSDSPAAIQDTPEGRVTSDVRLSVEAVSQGDAITEGTPQSILFQQVDLPAEAKYSEVWLSLDLDPTLGARISVNGTLVVTANLGNDDTLRVAAPKSILTLPLAYRIPKEVLAGGTLAGTIRRQWIAIELFSQAVPGTRQTFDLKLDAFEAVDAVLSNNGWLRLDPLKFQDGVRAILGERADVRSLADNYVTMRYGPNDKPGVFSDWTEPRLAEGWIKRVLKGINPFNQRVKDLFERRVNTDVSLLTQAGQRWEGDVALNLDVINNYGLIEIYETVLRRGRMLSIDAGINYGPANDALLLAAGYLNDLYMMLGHEAWADSANPTIGIGTKDRTYGEIATALFAFKGQVESVLEEELALLRGRDDFRQPGVKTSPVYNRLVWNYTRGIDAGEVVYALNYNIQENNDTGFNGVVDAGDARRLFPQGHGDAYGHYLTALKGYYSLMMDTDFDWVPRVEAVTVLGLNVAVDYLDERKFAAAAAAFGRAGRQVFDLTWRSDYQPGATGWKHFADGRTNGRNSAPTTRHWGLDNWATRTGQGDYLNWVMGNSILPDEDPDPEHEGIQKIDRQTVPELKELAALAGDLQTAVDSADAHLSPLGLREDSLAFDINPNKVVGGEPTTHFEQIYERALGALKNALAAFDDAKDVTRLMRSEGDSLADFQTNVAEQEQAYEHKLIDLYGTPYPDDMGPGQNYPSGYTGPDYDHYVYIDLVELEYPGEFSPQDMITNRVDSQLFPEDYRDKLYDNWDSIIPGISPDYRKGSNFVEYILDSHGFFSKPPEWTSRRQTPGRIQEAISKIAHARNQLASAFADADWAKWDVDKSIQMFNYRRDQHGEIRDLQRDSLIAENVAQGVEMADELLHELNEAAKFQVETWTDPSLPQINVIAGLAFGGNGPGKPGEYAHATTRAILGAAVDALGLVSSIVTKSLRFSTDTAARWTEFEKIAPKEWDQDVRSEVLDIGAKLSTLQGTIFPVNARLQELDDARRNYRSLVAEGDRIQEERKTFRDRAAAVIQGFRTRDAAFRIFRNEKLERYKSLFDLAARYSLLAANAYDYETGLLNTPAGKEFVHRIISARALGVVRNGEPQFAGSNTGDPGLSSALAEMKSDWDVLKGRLGFNNPDAYKTTVSLRTERYRLLGGEEGNLNWQDILQQGRKDDILKDADVRRFCLQIGLGGGLPVPGIILEFPTLVEKGLNLFGMPLAAGDHDMNSSAFATKIFALGVAFEGYRGMDDPSANSSAIGFAGASSPADPSIAFLDGRALAATPDVYLIPVGIDSMRTPPLGDQSQIRAWNVQDVTIPLPFNIGGSDFSTRKLWQSSDSLTEELFSLRKHQSFRPVSSASLFGHALYGSAGQLMPSPYTNRRLIGRSVWNSKWKLVIPGYELLNDPKEGLDRFIRTVTDVKLHFVTYSYAGN